MFAAWKDGIKRHIPVKTFEKRTLATVNKLAVTPLLTEPESAHVGFDSMTVVQSIAMAQEQLWEHFQSAGVDAFDQARWRLGKLLQEATRRTQGRSMLNIGCGNGWFERAAQSQGWKVISVDPDQAAMIRLISQGVDARVGRIEALPVNEGAVDVVICSEVFEHVSPQVMKEGLAEIRRVLKNGGLLIGTTPYRERMADQEVFCPHCRTVFHRWGHQQSFDEPSMRASLAEALNVIEVRPRYFPIWSTNWKGKAVNAALFLLSQLGSYGQNSNLFFLASK
jgi:SAM-dependent methyltransferase